LRRILGLTGPKPVREWLGFTLAKHGAELARLTGRTRPFDRRTVFGWENGKPMAREIVDAYGVLIANKLTADLDRIVGVKLIVNSPWHVKAWTACATCGHWFELHRARDRRCPECRQR
jgi:hypothetical protein